VAKKKKLVDFAFDDKAEEAVAEALRMAGKLITNISKTTEKNIRRLIAQAIQEGIPPRQAARLIQPLIGLDLVQGQAVNSFRDELIESGLSQAVITKKVDTYTKRLLRQRAVKISRTEILDALNAGQERSWRQAQKDGLLSVGATKVVILTPGACVICRGVAGAGAKPIGESFDLRGPPFHPSCRCTIAIQTP